MLQACEHPSFSDDCGDDDAQDSKEVPTALGRGLLSSWLDEREIFCHRVDTMWW